MAPGKRRRGGVLGDGRPEKPVQSARSRGLGTADIGAVLGLPCAVALAPGLAGAGLCSCQSAVEHRRRSERVYPTTEGARSRLRAPTVPCSPGARLPFACAENQRRQPPLRAFIPRPPPSTLCARARTEHRNPSNPWRGCRGAWSVVVGNGALKDGGRESVVAERRASTAGLPNLGCVFGENFLTDTW